MKEKILNALTSKCAYVVYSFAIALLAMLQEAWLGGSVNAWILALAACLVVGCLAEAFRYVISGGGYKLKNLLPWIVGGVAGTIAGYLV